MLAQTKYCNFATVDGTGNADNASTRSGSWRTPDPEINLPYHDASNWNSELGSTQLKTPVTQDDEELLVC
ncbi:unnamed protein product [Phytophthora fragariaefolia]|uniref:Unnamed protein product n=1 Tax=Phytophthora fragariaefolia TaxID=1490495 RepID=A0A9W6XVW7_9STRA|nr:unnamed protein product [Phytophthora fragariaefolia]